MTSPTSSAQWASALPAALAASYAVTPARAADSTELHQLLVAHRTSVLGFCHITLADIDAWLAAGSAVAVLNLVARRRDTGAAVQWWSMQKDQGDPRYLILVNTHPDVAEAEADALWQSAWSLLSDWARTADVDDSSDQLLLRSACLAGDAANARRLEGVGFAHSRTYWEMAGPVPAKGVTSTAVPGLTLAEGADPAVVHRLLQDGFAEHWDFYPQTLSEWTAAERAMPGHDPTLWVVAALDGEPVAAMILSRAEEAERELYVQELATLAPYRRRGIGSALLEHAFAVARREGLRGLLLHVDSDNPDGAPRLYAAAGLAVRHATHQYVLTLPRTMAEPGASTTGPTT